MLDPHPKQIIPNPGKSSGYERIQIYSPDYDRTDSSSPDLRDGHGFDFAGVADMWPATEVNQGPALVHGGRLRVHLLIQDPNLSRI